MSAQSPVTYGPINMDGVVNRPMNELERAADAATASVVESTIEFETTTTAQAARDANDVTNLVTKNSADLVIASGDDSSLMAQNNKKRASLESGHGSILQESSLGSRPSLPKILGD